MSSTSQLLRAINLVRRELLCYCISADIANVKGKVTTSLMSFMFDGFYTFQSWVDISRAQEYGFNLMPNMIRTSVA